MQLPYLKNKLPRQESKPKNDELVQGSASDHIDDKMVEELMDACASRHVAQFRHALEALLLNMFEDGDSDGA